MVFKVFPRDGKVIHGIIDSKILFHREDGKVSWGPLEGILYCLLRSREQNKGKASGRPDGTPSGGMERQLDNLARMLKARIIES